MNTETTNPALEPVGFYCDHTDEPLGERTHHNWETVDGEWTFKHCPDTIASHEGTQDWLKPEQREQRCPRAVPVYPGPAVQQLRAEVERLRIFADATDRRHEEIRAMFAKVDIRDSAEAWDLGMAVLAILDSPPNPRTDRA